MGIVVEALTGFVAFGGIVSAPGMYASWIENPYICPATVSGDRLKIDAGIGTHFSDIPWWYGFVSFPSLRFLGSRFGIYGGVEGYTTSFTGYGSTGEEVYRGVFGDIVLTAGAASKIWDSLKIGVELSTGVQKTQEFRKPRSTLSLLEGA